MIDRGDYLDFRGGEIVMELLTLSMSLILIEYWLSLNRSEVSKSFLDNVEQKMLL